MVDVTLLTQIRAREYGYLDEKKHVYLDHTGAGLPSRWQLRAHTTRIMGNAFGNPHSDNPTSAASDVLVASARQAVLRHFDADPREYAVVFTPNATGAIRLVGEAYPFAERSNLVLTADNHNSVNGLREYARSGLADTRYVPLAGPDLRIADSALDEALAAGHGDNGGLFAFPAQSNFTGVQHPLTWIEHAHARGYDVLLDAAAFVPTNPLNLSVVRPDFVAVSWYKVFGYPTGIGTLIARREALERLRRPWFSGGTVKVASAAGGWYRPADDETAFEDGTLDFLSIPDVEVGLDWIRSIGMATVHDHVTGLTRYLLDGLRTLRHANGQPLARIYGPPGTEGRGATVSLNLLDPHGEVIDERIVSRDSSALGISLRTGCFCNPGAGEAAFSIDSSALRGLELTRDGTVDDYLALLGLPSGGAVRVSVGLSSSRADVDAFLNFAADAYRDRIPVAEGLSPRLRC
ncbi:aminotransferase class V-fold PLP-dependent enzyme [Streptomyces sp. NPDC017991]|uniref:aminotransferase class V-fold PLP-dependent enzyme n=1 Tax=Streptomyces sp. NPDC017991 TaxID=3365026 RepID=UPI0037B9B48A